jgi:GH15 family glucan-1,4-alpha-glucosidase
MASKVEDYGLIGNMRTAALVSRSGSIDWLCAPRFDSDSCFAALVGYDEHGRWSIRPGTGVRESKQRYRGDFWLADNYAFGGRINDAEALFDRLLGLRNHLGLLAEEYEPALKRQIGNFPQAFSHLALIFTARVIDQAQKLARKPNQKGPAPKEAPRAP